MTDGSTDVNITTPEENNISFTYTDEAGNEVVCRVLYFFHADFNNKDYMVYTTGVVTDEGEEVSAAIYDPQAFEAMSRGEEADLSLLPLTTDLEWALVADTLRRALPDEFDVDDSEVVAEETELEVAEESEEHPSLN